MTELQQEAPVKAHNKAIVCVIAGLTTEQAECITGAIIHAKNNHAPDARGTIATGKEENVARMISDGHDTALPSTKKKKKKKKKKSKKNSTKNSNKYKSNKQKG